MTTEQPTTLPSPPAPTTSPQPAPAAPGPVKITPEMLAAKNYPKLAFYLASFGGVIMLVAGLFAIFFDAIYFAIVTDIPGIGLSFVLIGIMLIICSLFVSGAAASLLLKPELRKSAGVTIILFSLLALLFGGGWFVGAFLGLLGGIMAIFWKPTTVSA
jgi:hypothetical protein